MPKSWPFIVIKKNPNVWRWCYSLGINYCTIDSSRINLHFPKYLEYFLNLVKRSTWFFMILEGLVESAYLWHRLKGSSLYITYKRFEFLQINKTIITLQSISTKLTYNLTNKNIMCSQFVTYWNEAHIKINKLICHHQATQQINNNWTLTSSYKLLAFGSTWSVILFSQQPREWTWDTATARQNRAKK